MPPKFKGYYFKHQGHKQAEEVRPLEQGRAGLVGTWRMGKRLPESVERLPPPRGSSSSNVLLSLSTLPSSGGGGLCALDMPEHSALPPALAS